MDDRHLHRPFGGSCSASIFLHLLAIAAITLLLLLASSLSGVEAFVMTTIPSSSTRFTTTTTIGKSRRSQHFPFQATTSHGGGIRRVRGKDLRLGYVPSATHHQMHQRHRQQSVSLSTTQLNASSNNFNLWMTKFSPSCGPGIPTLKVILISGIISSSLQYMLYKLFKQSTQSKLSDHPEYTSHSIVALLLMILVSSIGVIGWWGWEWIGTSTLPPTINNKIIDPSSTARFLSAIIVGSFTMWDIPVSLRVPELRNIDVIIHHIVMLLLSVIGCTILPMHYAIYYFGVSELSSIPLVIYDQLKLWNTSTCNTNSNTTSKESPSRILQKLETIFGIITAIAFTIVRAIHFPYVTLKHFLPDCWKLLLPTTIKGGGGGVRVLLPPLNFIIPFLMVGSIGFSVLQLYWFQGLVQTIMTNGNDGDQ